MVIRFIHHFGWVVGIPARRLWRARFGRGDARLSDGSGAALAVTGFFVLTGVCATAN